MKEWKQNYEKDFLMKRMGSLQQLGGLRRYEFTEGRAKGMDAIEVVTGTGFDYTVLPGKCMDIGWARYKGVPVSYLTKSELSAASYVEPGLEWLRDFHAGMITTCGFSNLGAPCADTHPLYGDRTLWLHGRLSHLPASEICTKGEWIDGKYVMTMSGLMRQSAHGAENITLRRTITSVLGERKLHIHDVAENEGYTTEPFMLLYHINFGYPLLDACTRIAVNFESILPSDQRSADEIELRGKFHEPVHQCPDNNYYYRLKDLGGGKSTVAVFNDDLEIGAAVTANLDELPCLTQWKYLSDGDYVLALEPCNAFTIGQTQTKERGELRYIEPGQKRVTDVTLEILDGKAEMDAVEKRIMG